MLGLLPDPLLQSAAKSHSAAMDSDNFFSHDGNGSPVDRIRSTGYLAGASSWMVGEDLHWGVGSQATPKATVAHRMPVLDTAPRCWCAGSGTSGSGW